MTTAYQLQGAAPGSRPLCFAFNGGPGSASIWLHLGALGPKRVVVPDDGSMPAAPLHRGRQPADLVRALRPRLHRPAAHRLVDRRQRSRAQEDAVGGRRRRRAGRGDAHLAHAPPALGLAGLPGRRKLRHHARRRAGRQAADAGRGAERADPGVVRDGPAEPGLHARQRPAVRAVPAGVCQRLAVPRPAEGRRWPRRRKRRARRPRPSWTKTTPRRCRPARGWTASRRVARGAAHRRAHRPAAARWWKRRTCASATRPTSSRRCARRAGRSAGWRHAPPARWPPAAPASGSSTPASRPSRAPYTMAAMAYFADTLGISARAALRGAVARRAHELELEPRQGPGQQLRLHQPRPGACAAPQPAT